MQFVHGTRRFLIGFEQIWSIFDFIKVDDWKLQGQNIQIHVWEMQ